VQGRRISRVRITPLPEPHDGDGNHRGEAEDHP